MARAERVQKTTKRQKQANMELVDFSNPKYNREPAVRVTPKTVNQEIHKSALYSKDSMVIAIGPAGTGKTFLSAYAAADLYMNHGYGQIILTRPNVETGKSFGALPGELEEKYEPYLEPFKAGLIARMGQGKFQADWQKNIKPTPLQFMRGSTFDNSIVLLDEAQNTDIEQMKMLLTRIGDNSKLFISGDTNQTDLRGNNGLAWLVKQISVQQMPFEIVRYTWDDCVRSDFCKTMLRMIDQEVK